MATSREMTAGPALPLIFNFTMPLLLGNLLQQTYSLVDAAIVGKFLGINALAAVGASSSVIFLILGFCNGCSCGFGIPVAQKFGARDYVMMRRYVAVSLQLSLVMSVMIALITSIYCADILRIMRTPENIFEGAYAYLLVTFIGVPCTFLYNLLSSIIRALGDSKTPFWFLLFSTILNIILDLFCILVLKWGVLGAAIATVFSQGISALLCYVYMYRHFQILKGEAKEHKFQLHLARTLLNIGVPMGLQFSITAIGSVILQSAVNTLGSNAVASMTAGSKIGMFFCCPYDALGSTMATYGGQNVGAKKLDRLSGGLKAAGILGIGYSILAFVVLWLCGNHLAMFFVESVQAEVIANVRLFLVCNSAFYIPLAFVNIVRFLIQGMGYSKFAILAGVFEMAARTLVGFVFVPMFGYPAACFASPVAWIFADCFLFPAYFHVLKKTKKMLSEPVRTSVA